ncbi:MAG: dihydroorotate dehydrogenase-like protein [Propionibacteriaceae bacterium]|jgi:dihydroorotate dehydrogenase (fumarate)|nr:dihydroorotate dehydrogenase-like protein [Propionibacteriaceae bacterium]
MDLTTNYLGLRLISPLVASAGPISQSVDGIKALADAGVGAVTMFSLFEEQIRREAAETTWLATANDDANPEGLSYFPDVPMRLPGDQDSTTAAYLRLIEAGAAAIEQPLIASLNGATLGGWANIARQMEAAGASAIELNIYHLPGDGRLTGSDVENLHLDIVAAVLAQVSIPVTLKLSPFFSSLGAFVARLEHSGLAGLTLFNRFLQPDIDLTDLSLVPGLSLSEPIDARLPRTWISLLRPVSGLSLAASSGVATSEDVVKYLLAGADVVASTSALVRNGPTYAAQLLAGAVEWMEQRGFEDLGQVRGAMALPADQGDQLERQAYVAALQTGKRRYASLAGIDPGSSPLVESERPRVIA